MSALSPILRAGEGGALTFWCPGCQDTHTIVHGGGRWTWNGDAVKPTFQPSVLVRSGHYASAFKAGDECWCTWEKDHPGEAGFKCEVCHSFVTDGRIQFLSDCSHPLAGQTVDLPAFPEHIA